MQLNSCEREIKKCDRSNPADTEMSKERTGRRCARHVSKGSSAAHGEDHGEAGCPP